MKRALLIINPVSGTLKARDSLYDIVDTFTRNRIIPAVVFTRRKGHATRLAAAASPKIYDCIICMGGDGTLNEVIAGAVSSGSGLPIGYIPAGSTNDFASGLGIPLDPVEAAEGISRAVRAKKGISVDIGRFGADRYFTYIASFGAFTASSYNTPQSVKNVLGHLTYIFTGIRDFFRITPIHASVKADGRTYEGEYVFGGVCNSYSVGGIVRLSDDCVDISDGKFEIILVKAPRDIAEFNRVVTAVMTSDLDCDLIEFFKASSAEFRLPSGTVWTLDGESAQGGNTVVLSNLCRAVTLLTLPDDD